MITVENALNIILQNIEEYGTELIPIQSAKGRILKEQLFADRDFPPFNRVMMDGIAIQYAHFEKGIKSYKIEGIAAAGMPQLNLSTSSHCLEVMTGAILPINVDTVIRYEDVIIENGYATVTVEQIKKGQHIHSKGMDRLQGDLLVQPNSILSPAEIGIATTIGKTMVKVARLPKIGIISTGDELVEIGETPLPHQIRKSNVYCIQSILLEYGINASLFHLDDDMEIIQQQLSKIIEEYDVIILSGGVSKGKYDYLPKVFEILQIKKGFHKVKQRPGKPFWFGKAPNGCIIFALPGNPVSSFVCTHRYFLPWLRKSLNISNINQPYAILKERVLFKPDLVYFLQVKISFDKEGQICATPVPGNGSGDLANLVDADAFLELPRGKDVFEKGEVYPVIFYRFFSA